MLILNLYGYANNFLNKNFNVCIYYSNFIFKKEKVLSNLSDIPTEHIIIKLMLLFE